MFWIFLDDFVLHVGLLQSHGQRDTFIGPDSSLLIQVLGRRTSAERHNLDGWLGGTEGQLMLLFLWPQSQGEYGCGSSLASVLGVREVRPKEG